MLRAVVRESAIYGIGRIGTALIAFLTLPIYTSVFSPEEFGVLNLFVTAGVLFGLVTAVSLPTAVTRYFHDKQIGEARVFSATASFILIWGVTLFALAMAVVFGLGLFDLDASHGLVLALALAGALVSQFVELIALFIRMRRKPGLFLLITLPGAIGGSLISVGLVLLFGGHILLYFAGIFVGQALSLTIGLRKGGVEVEIPSDSTRQVLSQLLRFSLPLFPASLIQYILNYSDQWILASMYNVESVGIYAVGSRFGGATLIATSLIMFAFLPHSMRLIHEDDSSAGDQLERTLRILSTFFWIVTICVTVASPILLRLLIDSQYHGAFVTIGMISLSHVFFAYTYFSSLGSWKAERSVDYSIAVFVGVAINLVLNVIFIPRFGILGAGVNMAVSMGAVAILSFGLSAVRHPFPFSYGRLAFGSLLTFGWVFSVSTLERVKSGPFATDIATAGLLILVLLGINLKADDYAAGRRFARDLMSRTSQG